MRTHKTSVGAAIWGVLWVVFAAEIKKKKTLVGLLIEIHCAGERIRREGTAALVSFTAELPRRLLPGRCQDSRSLVAGKGTPY